MSLNRETKAVNELERKETTATLATNELIVRSFLETWKTFDLDAVMDYFADNAVYQNLPLPPAQGKSQIRSQLKIILNGVSKFEVDFLNVATQGNVVLTERIDHFVSRGLKIRIPVSGTFIIKDRKIAEWRDYFDWLTIGWCIVKSLPQLPFYTIKKLLERNSQ